MCALCAALSGSRYWTDAAGNDAFRIDGAKVTLRKEREKRVALLNRVLAPKGIAIKDWGGNSYILQDGVGRRENVYNLAGVWTVVDRLGDGLCDPLDPDLLDILAQGVQDGQK